MQAVRTIRQESELIGEKRGETRGMQKGIRRSQEGAAERMLLMGMDIPLIEDLTDLPAQEIMKLSDKLGLSKD